MLNYRSLLPLCALSLLVACGKQPNDASGESTIELDAAATNRPGGSEDFSADAAGMSSANASQTAGAEQAAPNFDYASVPISSEQLGEFPYFGLPAGYEVGGTRHADVDRFPFWTGDHFEWVEGRNWGSFITTAQDKQFSSFELEKNIDALITKAGGVKVFEGEIPSGAIDSLNKDFQVEHNTGGVNGSTSRVYLLRRADRNIWVYLSTYSAGGGWTIAETQPFQPTAVLLDEFPYIGFPAGYKTDDVRRADLDRFAFWTGDHFEWVEGKVWSSQIRTEQDKGFAPYEFQKNIEALVTAADGVKLFEGEIPSSAIDTLDKSFWGKYDVRGVNGSQSRVYRFTGDDRSIWVLMSTYSAGGGITVAESEPFKLTASLLPAAELKRELDATGKVALHVNFATDKTDILPESQAQIDQVVQLMKEDSSLRLAVNGHTDNSGTAAHNQQLSEGRARSVVVALTAKGIDASRVTAKGFGQSAPVADNATEEGKAANRRVELVKM